MCRTQRAKKVVSDSPGQVNFAIGLVNYVLNLPGQVKLFEKFKFHKNCVINPTDKKFWGLAEMNFG